MFIQRCNFLIFSKQKYFVLAILYNNNNNNNTQIYLASAMPHTALQDGT